MFTYFDLLFVQHIRGLSYIPTLYIQTIAIVLLLNDLPKTWREWLKKVIECLGSCIAVSLIGVVYMTAINEEEPISFVSLAVFTLLYALLRSKYPANVCLVRGLMFLACIMVSVPISSPISDLIRSVSPSIYYSWGQFLTLVIIFLLAAIVVAFLRHYSLEAGSLVQTQYLLLQVGISLVTIAIELTTYWVEIPRGFNVLICAGLWGINLLAYYLFYSSGKSARENLVLRSTQHRIEMEREKYEANRVNYDELRVMRHELKNYTFYARALLDSKKYDELSAFLDESIANKSQVLTSYDSGNYIIDVIMNHEMNAAREQGVAIIPDILVPHKLPFCDEDLCCLLSNLMDNAIEAATDSGQDAPQITFSMRPKQEYLFIHEENPISEKIPSEFRLSLKTTKQNQDLHGFGTKIIRRIVDKYNGSIKYSIREGRFITDVMLELGKEELE